MSETVVQDKSETGETLVDVSNLKMHFPIYAGLFRRKVMGKERAVLDIAVQLVGVRLPFTGLAALGPAPACQRSHTWRTLVVDDVVRISAGIFRRAVFLGESADIA